MPFYVGLPCLLGPLLFVCRYCCSDVPAVAAVTLPAGVLPLVPLCLPPPLHTLPIVCPLRVGCSTVVAVAVTFTVTRILPLRVYTTFTVLHTLHTTYVLPCRRCYYFLRSAGFVRITLWCVRYALLFTAAFCLPVVIHTSPTRLFCHRCSATVRWC